MKHVRGLQPKLVLVMMFLCQDTVYSLFPALRPGYTQVWFKNDGRVLASDRCSEDDLSYKDHVEWLMGWHRAQLK